MMNDSSLKQAFRSRSARLQLDTGNNDQAAQAAASLDILLHEDSRLVEFGLTTAGASFDQVAFPYAAALMEDVTIDPETKLSTQQRAEIALQDVDRKLALVESLAVKLSRTSPEAIADHLLRLHGYIVSSEVNGKDVSGQEKRMEYKAIPTNTVTLSSIRDRSDRLERQAETLETVAKRVENSLNRGLIKMESTTLRLSRVLTLSSTLKRIMRLQFETSKLQTYDLDDLRDLTKAAASVAILEDLLNNSELHPRTKISDPDNNMISIVERMRPQALETASAVRKAASTLLNELLRSSSSLTVSDNGTAQMIQQLGATLQVYYHLGELPQAVWKAVDHAFSMTETASRELYNAVTLSGLQEKAKKAAKDARNLQKRLIQVRADAAHEWANGILVAATLVQNLNRVLRRKTDHARRQVYLDVIAESSIPTDYSEASGVSTSTFSLFQVFWDRFCHGLSIIVANVLQHDNGRFRNDVAALYPSVRTAALGLVSQLQHSKSLNPSTSLNPYDDSNYATTSSGILGGSSMLDDDFLQWTTGRVDDSAGAENPQSAWTSGSVDSQANVALTSTNRNGYHSASTLTIGINTFEWKALAGNKQSQSGMYVLESNFLHSCQERLRAPLQYMFPGNDVALDDDGVPMSSGLSLLPSKYDIQRFDETIRNELVLADSREGGGDLTLVTMITESVVMIIAEFCVHAKDAMSGLNGEEAYITEDFSITSTLEHDRKLVAILYAVRNYLLQAPDKTYVAPYRPAVLPRHQEAANLCLEALAPAISDIDNTVRQTVIIPLCRALNQGVFNVLARISHGVYLGSKDVMDDNAPGFIQTYLSPILERIEQHLAKFPPLYSSLISEKIATFSVYCYLSNMSLVRPIGESTRLRVTQDLADLEMALDLLLSKTGGLVSLQNAELGRPYGELRAVRSMLYWTGLESNKEWSAHDVTKSLLRELWMKDIRSSTVFHYLFSFAPSLLSSPHHSKRIKSEDYVKTLVQLDGSIVAGEDSAWMTIMACCDSYQQRVSSSTTNLDGDPRIAQIVILLGQEFLRRKRH